MMIINKYNVNPISFRITNTDDQDLFSFYYKFPSYKTKIQSILYFTAETQHIIANSSTNYIYLSLLTTDAESPDLLFQRIDFSKNDITTDGLLKFVFNINVPFRSDIKDCIRVRLSYSSKDWTTYDLNQSLIDGAFLDTLVPYEVIKDNEEK